MSIHSNTPLQPSEYLLSDDLHNFHLLLKWCALDHSSPSESGLAVIGFLTLLCFFRKFRLRQLLFLDDPTLVKLAEVSYPFIKSSCAALNFVMFLFVLLSWAYRTGVFLLVCVLFRLTCELLILRFRGLHKMFDRCGSDTIEDVCKEHVKIKKQLSATSHSLTRVSSTLVIWWYALQFSSVDSSCASASPESVTDSSDNIYINVSPSLDLSSFFQARQALVEYLRHNNKGITLYGYALDRGLLHTLFAFEFSLVMWILSKVVVLS
ncbi:hypothetical protein AALP_AAs47289U000300 [Arabis alpina]|uniref:Uncharacterized protein n=1 Tax=Arabis alpina TaxID=50452 RepID=A0A087G239_ARAAL|nr:hypothetical protein AALP_AAs47289U000300 [Arabis alpina]